jgi:FixJ family two-component response regulator
LTTADEIIYVIDDDPRVRDALSDLLDAFGYANCCFANASEYLKSERKDAASCIVLDMRLPDINGLDLQDILAEQISPPIVFMSGFADVPSTVRAMKKGATEFLTKPVDPDALLTAVREAQAKDSERRTRRAEVGRIEERFKTLTPREREVFGLVVSGLLNKQSAHALGIIEATLQVHRGQIMRKMEARSFAELVRMASTLNVPNQKS